MHTVSLRPMTADAFADYRVFFLDDYSAEIVENYRRSPQEALAQATKAIQTDLPLGPKTNGQILQCIVTRQDGAAQTVGYLWHSVDAETQSAFIHDFIVLVEFRSQGFGTAAMQALEQDLTRQGVTQIKLRVAYSNTRALGLYKRLGFFATGTNMARNIGADHP